MLHQSDMRSFFLILLFAVAGIANAEIPRGSAVAFALGGIPNFAAPSPLDIGFNPALSCSSQYSLETNAARLFEMSDFDIASGGAARRMRRVTFSLAAAQIVGLDYYTERSINVAASVAALPILRLGIALEQQRLEFSEGYPGASTYCLAAGAVYTPSDRARIAISAANINRPRFDDADDPLPLRFEVAGAFRANPAFCVLVAHHLDERMPDRFSIGELTSISREFDLILGLKTEPVEISGGFSLKLRGFSLDYAYCNNVYLGGTHRVGLRYSH